MIGVRTKLQKYVHDWYPYPDWGGGYQGVYSKGEYGKALAKEQKYLRLASVRGTLSADHFSILDTEGQWRLARRQLQEYLRLQQCQLLKSTCTKPIVTLFNNRRVTGGGERARPYTGEDTLKPTLYPITLSPVRELDRG